MDGLFTLESWLAVLTIPGLIALLTLTTLEVVLGIDNVIFIAILTDKLPEKQRPRARTIGLALAAGTRILLLLAITWIMRLQEDLFTVLGNGISGKDLILLGGGLFLLAKATYEIHESLEPPKAHTAVHRVGATFAMTIVQILALDLVFSLDSVITAVGMTEFVSVMVAAILVAVGIMIAFAGPVSRFIERHPTMRMLALTFLVLIGVMLMVEGCGKHIEKGYIYFAMAFSFVVELLNMRARKSRAQAELSA